MAPPPPGVSTATRHAALIALALCACSSAAPAQRTQVAAAAPADPERPRIVHLTDEELFVAGLEGCQISATPDDPVVAYCPEAVFGLNAVRGDSPDTLFNQWLDEVQRSTGDQLTVVERHQEKLFGPNVTALRLILRHPRAALEATNLVYVALVEVRGELRRVWCSTPSHEPAGIARCQQGLLSAAHARLR